MIYNKFVSIVRQLSIQPDYILPQKRLLYSKCKANLIIIINNSTCKRLLRYAKRGDGYRKATINTKAATCTQCLLQKKRQSVVCRRLNCYVACFCHLSRPPPYARQAAFVAGRFICKSARVDEKQNEIGNAFQTFVLYNEC